MRDPLLLGERLLELRAISVKFYMAPQPCLAVLYDLNLTPRTSGAEVADYDHNPGVLTKYPRNNTA